MNNLKKLRLEKNLSLASLSKELEKSGVKISRASLNNYEREDQSPKKETWEKLAEYFGVSVPYIMGLTDEKNENQGKEILNLMKKINSDGIDLHSGDDTVSKYLESNILELSKLLVTLKNNDQSQQILTFLLALNRLKQKEDSRFESLLNILDILTSPHGLYNGDSRFDIFSSTIPIIKDGKNVGKKRGEASAEIALSNYLIQTDKIKSEIDNCFLEQFNNHYNK